MTGFWWEVARRPGELGEPAVVEWIRVAADPNPMPRFDLFPFWSRLARTFSLRIRATA